MKTISQIDTNTWVTQKALADELNIRVQNVHNWVQRGNIKWQYLPGSSIKLVDKNSLVINTLHHKRQ